MTGDVQAGQLSSEITSSGLPTSWTEGEGYTRCVALARAVHRTRGVRADIWTFGDGPFCLNNLVRRHSLPWRRPGTFHCWGHSPEGSVSPFHRSGTFLPYCVNQNIPLQMFQKVKQRHSVDKPQEGMSPFLNVTTTPSPRQLLRSTGTKFFGGRWVHTAGHRW